MAPHNSAADQSDLQTTNAVFSDDVAMFSAIAGGVAGLLVGLSCGVVAWRAKCSCGRTSAATSLSPASPTEEGRHSQQPEALINSQRDAGVSTNVPLNQAFMSSGGRAPASASLPLTSNAEDGVGEAMEAGGVAPSASSEAMLPAVLLQQDEEGRRCEASSDKVVGTLRAQKPCGNSSVHVASKQNTAQPWARL